MTITYSLDARDIRAFRRHVRLKSRQAKRLRLTSGILFALVALLFTAASGIGSLSGRAIFFFLIFGLMFFTSRLINWVYVRIYEWRMLSPQKQKGVICEHSISLQEDSVVETTPVDQNSRSWSGVLEVSSDDNYIYIFLTPEMAHIVPKRAFPLAEAAEAFFTNARDLHRSAAAASQSAQAAGIGSGSF